MILFSQDKMRFVIVDKNIYMGICAIPKSEENTEDLWLICAGNIGSDDSEPIEIGVYSSLERAQFALKGISIAINEGVGIYYALEDNSKDSNNTTE